MIIERTFKDIQDKLKANHRAFVQGSDELKAEIINFLDQGNYDREKLAQIMCILERLQNPETRDFEAKLFKLLKDKTLGNDQIIFVLNAIRNISINARQRTGERLPLEFFEALRPLFKTKSMEVMEWLLRTLEETGSQSVILKGEVENIRLKFWNIFSSHGRNVGGLINFLQNKWRGNGQKPS